MDDNVCDDRLTFKDLLIITVLLITSGVLWTSNSYEKLHPEETRNVR